MNKILVLLVVIIISLAINCVRQEPPVVNVYINSNDSLERAGDSLASMFAQGSLLTTSSITDLAISGTGFFVIEKSGDTSYFRRPGQFYVNPSGYLALRQDTSAHLLGVKLFTIDSQGVVFGTTAATASPVTKNSLAPIRFNVRNGDFNMIRAAHATTSVQYYGNLDSDGNGLGTITHSNAFLRLAGVNTLDVSHNSVAVTSPELISLYDENGNSLGIQVGDEFAISVSDNAVPNVNVHVASGMTLDDLNGQISTFVGSVSTGATSLMKNGTIIINNGPGNASINGFEITSSNPTSKSYVMNAFTFGNIVAAGITAASSKTLLTPALQTDDIATLYDASGNSLMNEFIVMALHPKRCRSSFR